MSGHKCTTDKHCCHCLSRETYFESRILSYYWVFNSSVERNTAIPHLETLPPPPRPGAGTAAYQGHPLSVTMAHSFVLSVGKHSLVNEDQDHSCCPGVKAHKHQPTVSTGACFWIPCSLGCGHCSCDRAEALKEMPFFPPPHSCDFVTHFNRQFTWGECLQWR